MDFKQPQLSKLLKKAIGSRQIHVVAAECELSPATLNKILNHDMIPTQTRVVKAISNFIERNK